MFVMMGGTASLPALLDTCVRIWRSVRLRSVGTGAGGAFVKMGLEV